MPVLTPCSAGRNLRKLTPGVLISAACCILPPNRRHPTSRFGWMSSRPAGHGQCGCGSTGCPPASSRLKRGESSQSASPRRLGTTGHSRRFCSSSQMRGPRETQACPPIHGLSRSGSLPWNSGLRLPKRFSHRRASHPALRPQLNRRKLRLRCSAGPACCLARPARAKLVAGAPRCCKGRHR